MQSASGGNHGSRSWFVRVRLWRGLRPSVAKGDSYRKIVEPCQPCKARVGETTPVAHGGDPQDRTGSPRPRCIAINKYLTLFCITC
ncbi:MAG: hypothetical protein F6J98_09920 [Moorea sp. SIO4G2]|nr:hypothetical protein [Moorena sp. SIO4G2]